MTSKKTTLLTFCTALLVFWGFLTPIQQVSADTDSFSVAAKAAIAVDAESGKVLFNQNADTPLPIASMTKMISMYLVLEAVNDGKLAWDDKISVSNHTSTLSLDNNLSNVPLTTDQQYTVKELFDASAIFSANGAIIALAEKVGGSEKDFVDLMRKKVESWGIKDAYLISSSGLNNEDMKGSIYPGSGKNDENKMSAKDVAIVCQRLIQDYPEFLDVTKTSKKVFGKGTSNQLEMTSWNWMLKGGAYYKEGVDGLKTGTTNLAGACFAGTIKKNDWRLITVVMNATNHKTDNGARFVETGKLMDHVYDSWSKEVIVEKGSQIPKLKTLPVEKGKAFSVSIATTEDITAWVRKDMDLEQIQYQFTPKGDDKTQIAPVKNGQNVGTVTVTLEEDTLGYLTDSSEKYTSKVGTTESVKKANIFVLGWRSVKDFFANLF